jgi:hypothetical protein
MKAARTLAIHFLVPGPSHGWGPVPAPSHGRGSRDWQCPNSFTENILFSERNESLMADIVQNESISKYRIRSFDFNNLTSFLRYRFCKKNFNGTTKNKLNIGLFEGNRDCYLSVYKSIVSGWEGTIRNKNNSLIADS